MRMRPLSSNQSKVSHKIQTPKWQEQRLKSQALRFCSQAVYKSIVWPPHDGFFVFERQNTMVNVIYRKYTQQNIVIFQCLMHDTNNNYRIEF